MCGILGVLDIADDAEGCRRLALRQVQKLRHRGPDWSGIYCQGRAVLAHERLSIVDVEHGAQPLVDSLTGRALAVNGEIYNHLDLRGRLRKPHDWRTRSDCEVILYLYDEFGPEFIHLLNGIFAFVLYDPRTDDYMIARDHLGIVPLYRGWDARGRLYVASEMKGLIGACERIEEFPPGHYDVGHGKPMTRYYHPAWMDAVPDRPLELERLRDGLEHAVKRQLMCDVPFGLLISGGVDSSIIAAAAAKFSARRVEERDLKPAWWPQLHSFSVGLKGGPDLGFARRVAEHIGTVHHEVVITAQEGVDALSDVIYHLETFDVTTIRAATPMFLMARKIKAMGIKMILSGEGADEVFGGYLYFHKAPNGRELHEETVRKLLKLHQYDCLRANKSTAAWGVEARVPFLDKAFLDIAMSFDPEEKRPRPGRIEKYVLRKAFEGYIPDAVLWRQKEQFSDGVGYGWIDRLKALAAEQVSDAMMAGVAERFPVNAPLTKEQYMYRLMFEERLPHRDAAACVPVERSVACSTPTALRWDKAFAEMVDPSGRAVRDVHNQAAGR